MAKTKSHKTRKRKPGSLHPVVRAKPTLEDLVKAAHAVTQEKLEQMKAQSEADREAVLAASAGSARDTVSFVHFARLAEALEAGHDYAIDARLPHIPERYAASPDLRDSWITGYVQELRNRLEAQNDQADRSEASKI